MIKISQGNINSYTPTVYLVKGTLEMYASATCFLKLLPSFRYNSCRISDHSPWQIGSYHLNWLILNSGFFQLLSISKMNNRAEVRTISKGSRYSVVPIPNQVLKFVQDLCQSRHCIYCHGYASIMPRICFTGKDNGGLLKVGGLKHMISPKYST